jgi:predicted nucleotidyltransferase
MRTKKKSAIDWLFPEVRKKTLVLLLSNPEKSWHLRDIERQTSLAIGTVHRELEGLVNAEIAIKSKDGNRTYYKANRQCPFLPELSGLLRKTAGLVDVLREVLAPLLNKINVAFVHGSFAKGTVKAESDVDLIVIGSCTFSEVVDAIHDAQVKLSREVNPTVYPLREWHEKLDSGNHFVHSVLESPEKIFIIGSKDELAGLDK